MAMAVASPFPPGWRMVSTCSAAPPSHPHQIITRSSSLDLPAGISLPSQLFLPQSSHHHVWSELMPQPPASYWSQLHLSCDAPSPQQQHDFSKPHIPPGLPRLPVPQGSPLHSGSRPKSSTWLPRPLGVQQLLPPQPSIVMVTSTPGYLPGPH